MEFTAGGLPSLLTMVTCVQSVQVIVRFFLYIMSTHQTPLITLNKLRFNSKPIPGTSGSVI